MIGDRIEVNIAGGLDIPLPRMTHVRQRFATPKVASVGQTIAEQFSQLSGAFLHGPKAAQRFGSYVRPDSVTGQYRYSECLHP